MDELLFLGCLGMISAKIILTGMAFLSAMEMIMCSEDTTDYEGCENLERIGAVRRSCRLPEDDELRQGNRRRLYARKGGSLFPISPSPPHLHE